MECLSCLALSGDKPISPGRTIFDGRYWKVEHAYPVALKGWIVIVLKRHVEALHDLTPEEAGELGTLQHTVSTLLHKHLHTLKEYSCLFAEKEGFHHVHFHIIARSTDLPEEYQGARIMQYLALKDMSPVPAEDIKQFCEALHDDWL